MPQNSRIPMLISFWTEAMSRARALAFQSILVRILD
jgi:hypothetical protein